MNKKSKKSERTHAQYPEAVSRQDKGFMEGKSIPEQEISTNGMLFGLKHLSEDSHAGYFQSLIIELYYVHHITDFKEIGLIIGFDEKRTEENFKRGLQILKSGVSISEREGKA
jgi:hypothetical protein